MITPGQILQKRRLELRKRISQVSQETKIQEKYIKLLELDEYNPFASDIYISGFLKIYSEYLGLDVEKMLALYRRTYKKLDTKEATKKTATKINFNKLRDLLNPLNIAIIVVLLAITGFVYFTVSQYNKLQQRPQLTIEQPKNNSETKESTTTLKGKTNKESEIKINNQTTDNNNGNFSKELTLSEGENVFTVEAFNPDTELKTIKTVKVTYKIEKVTEKPKPVEPTSFSTYVEIVGEAAWIQLVIDDQQEIAQVVNPGKTETLKITKNVQLITGKPTITKLYVNDKLIPLKINPTTGVASASCTIESNQLNCSN